MGLMIKMEAGFAAATSDTYSTIALPQLGTETRHDVMTDRGFTSGSTTTRREQGHTATTERITMRGRGALDGRSAAQLESALEGGR